MANRVSVKDSEFDSYIRNTSAALSDDTRLPLSRSRKAQVLHQLKQCSMEHAQAVHQLNSTRTIPENHHTLSSTHKTGTV